VRDEEGNIERSISEEIAPWRADPVKVRTTARHEAGHLLVAKALGFKRARFLVDEDGEACVSFARDWNRPEDMLAVIVGGLLADDREFENVEELLEDLSPTDRAVVVRALDALAARGLSEEEVLLHAEVGVERAEAILRERREDYRAMALEIEEELTP
jgi:hypothetical protein